MRSREVYRRCGRRTDGEGHVSFGFLAHARFNSIFETMIEPVFGCLKSIVLTSLFTPCALCG